MQSRLELMLLSSDKETTIDVKHVNSTEDCMQSNMLKFEIKDGIEAT